MIPIQLTIAGFLSYREPIDVDFTRFDLACIAGSNGAGKSSLLDAITWALFGQARKRDDSVINVQANAARVELIFGYENNVFRVQRVKPRDKTMLLEFHIWDPGEITPQATGSDERAAPRLRLKGLLPNGSWRPLTERTLRETEARILQTLRMDYETFTNASFFLQGKADQFTQQRPGDRKRILSSILGLEIWERYREQTAERRKGLEAEIKNLDGRLQEVAAELAQEAERRQRLRTLEDEVARLAQQRQAQESIVQNARQMAASLKEQERLVEALSRQLQAADQRRAQTQARRAARSQERQELAEKLGRAGEIEAAYAAWQAARARLEQFEQTALQFREQELARQAPLADLQAARARLEQEQAGLRQRLAQSASNQVEIDRLRQQLEAEGAEILAAETRLERRQHLDSALQDLRQRQADARAENPRLKKEMEDLRAHIDNLSQLEGVECPFCRQPLGEPERLALIQRLTDEGTEMGDRFRANLALMSSVKSELSDLEAQMGELSRSEADLRQHSQAQAQLTARLEGLEAAENEWQAGGAARLEAVDAALANETYAPEARARLEAIDAGLKQIGYDAAAHDAARREEAQGRASEADLRELEKSRAALAPLEREMAEVEVQLAAQAAEVERQQQEYTQAAAALAAAQAQAPDLYAAETLLFTLQEQENRARMDVGAARQKVNVLDDLKARRKKYEADREALARQVQQHKTLERAFGKDGVPALLIEQALPEIETRANDILARLSNGGMSVRFVTQAQYKDKHRDDLKETLDIQISDGAGTRDYEMFSGGEAFRVNFAVRLALSEVLAQRSGARLQTLVIDEGFGSQDVQGRQRLVEAINLVRPDFAKILVITHIEELKDSFPCRIEVEKTDLGSSIRVL